MNILKHSPKVRAMMTRSTDLYKQGNPNHFYVYQHSKGHRVYYIGMGSHDRAVRVAGRSRKWNELAKPEELTVRIISSLTSYELAEKIEQQQIQIFKSAVNDQLTATKGNCFDPVLQFNREGDLIARYGSIAVPALLGFSHSCIKSCCNGERGLHKNFVWMYNSDYEKNGFTYKKTVNETRKIQQISSEGNIVRELLTASAFEKFGLSPKNIQQVCAGAKKSHQGFYFRYVQ